MERLEQRLMEMIRGEVWLMDLLRIARSLQLPDWYIAAGAIRNTVWDMLHDYVHRTALSDVDLVYFDASTTDHAPDLSIWESLMKTTSYINWNVVNQSRGHLLNRWTPPVSSTEESIAYWSETPTCVGIRLESDDALTVCAPHGLDDLMSLVVRPVPKPYQNLELYRKRIAQKQWHKTWPKLNVIQQ